MPCDIDGVPAAIQSLNTGIREASFSDATVRLRSFEALAVSQSLHGKNGISKIICPRRLLYLVCIAGVHWRSSFVFFLTGIASNCSIALS